MKKKFFFIAFLPIFFSFISFIFIPDTKKKIQTSDGFCGIKNTAFLGKEQIKYDCYYSIGGAYILAGDAVFTCVNEVENNKNVYHIEGVGNSNKKYDFIFKVRDKYESWIDTSNFQPIKFNRKVREGKYKKSELITFNHKLKTANTTNNQNVTIPDCIQDVLSATYYARNINFNKMEIGEKKNFSMFIDAEVYNMYIKYMGKEIVKTKFGKFNAIKFKPLLIKGTIFEGGEKMTVWVSDDENHLPLRIESPISVGSIKVDMMEYTNIRYPLISLIN